MECRWVSMDSVIEASCTGGWGKPDREGDYDTRVAIIRGADFPNIKDGLTDGLAIRWEKASKVRKTALRPGDIVIEISGGTDNRPTGRTILISDELVRQYDMPVIPASFCRLIRPGQVDATYLYYWLQDMYSKGRTWNYQNRSTGLSNFQYKTFLREEIISLPKQVEQGKISVSLGALDEKIRLNNRINDHLAA